MSLKWRVSCAAKAKAHENTSQELIGSIGKGFLAFSVAAAASFSVCFDSPAMAESLTVAFPVSRTTEVIRLLSFYLIESYVCISSNYLLVSCLV